MLEFIIGRAGSGKTEECLRAMREEMQRQPIVLDPNLGVSASHEAWLAMKRADGWTYGPIKDPVKKEHPCFVPYADLPAEQKAKDFIFRGVVHAIAREMAR